MEEEKNNQQEQNDKNQEPMSELEKCKQESQEYLNGWKRAKADLINYKKDEAKRLEELLGISKLLALKDFIPILDNLNKALESFEIEGKDEKGISMICSQLQEIFKKHGLEEIEVKKGDEFNPDKHEAIEEIEAEVDSGKIAHVVEKGYKLDGQVIRPTKVKLSKGKK